MNDLERAEALYNAQLRLELVWHVVITISVLYFAFWFIARRRHLKTKDKPMDFALNGTTFESENSI